MLRLGTSVALVLLLTGACHEYDKNDINPRSSDINELLKAHDDEVSRSGNDIKYISMIGKFGRNGVIASINHMSDTEISSYNGIELVFGVAESARVQTGYDICRDRNALLLLRSRAETDKVPSYQRNIYRDLLHNYCTS